MKKIFVDTENTNAYNYLKDLDLSKNDKIYLFVSQNSKSINMEQLEYLLSFNCKIEMIKIQTFGKDSMDIQIGTYLGLNVSKSNQHYILSNDKGYTSSISILNTLGYNVELIDCNYIKSTSNKSKNENNKNKSTENTITSNLSNEKIENESMVVDELQVARIFKEYENDSDVHNNLVHYYGEKGREIYREYKISKILKESKSKSDFHNKLLKNYGEKGKEIYKEYKANNYTLKNTN